MNKLKQKHSMLTSTCKYTRHSLLIIPMAHLLLLLLLLTTTTTTCLAQSSLCRTSCGPIPVSYPFGIDPGCGSPYYHSLLTCDPSTSLLLLHTPSGRYPVHLLSYSDPHLLLSDPSMWSCSSARSPLSPPFALDTSTRLSLSPKNDFLFFNCSPEFVLVHPKPPFCDRFPDRCDSVCDSSGYLCRNLPGCPDRLADTGTTCCSYYPTASESVRLMLRHCGGGYASVYWRTVGEHVPSPYDQVPEYGIRVDFEVPVTARCRKCRERGGGICGYDTETREFLCLCRDGNVTTYCGDASLRHKTPAGVIAGTTTVASIAGLASSGALIWYLRKMRRNKVVTCGVETTENRVF